MGILILIKKKTITPNLKFFQSATFNLWFSFKFVSYQTDYLFKCLYGWTLGNSRSRHLHKKAVVNSLRFPLISNQFYFKILLTCSRKINLFVMLSEINIVSIVVKFKSIFDFYELLVMLFMQKKLFLMINLAYFTFLHDINICMSI